MQILGKKEAEAVINIIKRYFANACGKAKQIVTTFIDYFELPDDFPNSEKCNDLTVVNEKIKCFENIMKEGIVPANLLFIPYIQKHEFEA